MLATLPRSCAVCTEELDALDSAGVTTHTGCCEHPNVEAALSLDGTSERLHEAWCPDCGHTLWPERNEDGGTDWVEAY